MSAVQSEQAQPEKVDAPVKGKPLLSSADLIHGQAVIVTARWILVLAGLILTLWNPDPVNKLRIEILVILLLAGANFYLHAQLLMKRPAVDSVVYGATLGDLAVISILILTGGGFASQLYIFYFLAILAFSVAFPPAVTLFYLGGIASFYTIVALGSSDLDPLILLSRLLMFGAMATCGTFYLQIEANRREAMATAQAELLAQIRQRRSA